MSGFELLITGLQVHRSFENFANNQFPKENLPAATAEFIALSSTILKGVAIEAAAAANLRSSAQMYAQVMPLIQTLNGISLAGNVAADVFRFGAALDGGNQAEINEAGLKLILASAGALLATSYLLAGGAAGMALLGPAGLGYLAGGLLAGFLIKIAKDPLVLDLDGDGVELSSLENSTVHFDYAGDGFAERTGWVSADDGILAIDDNGNGKVDSGLELFGSAVQDGFAVLDKLDSNGDGRIDAQDTDFIKLRVWRDLNQDGVSDTGELMTLVEAGVASISLHRQPINGNNQGNGVGFGAEYTRPDGTTGAAETIYFRTDTRVSVADPTPTFTPAAGVELLPQLDGSGLINSIGYRASNDVEFREAWEALTDNAASLSASELRSEFQVLLLRWAGVDTVDASSRGQFVNAQHLAFLEKFYGDNYREIQRDEEVRSYPSTAAFGAEIETAFQKISNVLELAFLSQVGLSVLARGHDPDLAVDNPYFFYCFLDLAVHGPDDAMPDTPANVGAVVDIIAAAAPESSGASVNYLTKALVGLDGLVTIAFDSNRALYAAAVIPHLNVITDDLAREIATHIVDGTARFGTTHAEGLNGSSADDVFIGGGGGDLVSGGAGSDIYVYAKHDGNLWIKDDGAAPADSDKLVFTDLNASSVTFDRIGNDLLIRVTETGKAIAATGFFAGEGIEVLRFADGTEWGRTQIKDASVFRGDGRNNTIYDSGSDDVIYGSQGDDYIRISDGNDTILYGEGDGYDIVTGSASLAEHDRLVLTDLNAADIQLSRVGGHLIMTVKSTGEYVDFDNFFPVNTADWETTARNIDEIKFANGESWNRQEIQQNAWYRGTDRGDSIGAAELNDTIAGGKGDDNLEGGYGSDLFVWKKGDGNDQISDASSTILQPNNTDVDTLWLQDVTAGDVSYSYQGKSLVLTINSTGEQIAVSGFFTGVTSLLTGAGTNYVGIDVIKFADGTTIDRQQITYNAGAQYLGWNPQVYTYVIAGSVQWSFFIDEFGHQGNIVGNQALHSNDIWNARAWGGFGGALGGSDSLNPLPFVSYTDNTVNGSSVRDIMAAGDGKDIVSGREGDDILYGDFVDDDVAGDNDVIDAGAGNDEVYGGGGMDIISGFTGNDYLSGGAGKDYIYGGAGDDTVVGGVGDDVLINNDAGTSGSDTYIYGWGDSNDTIIESGSPDSAHEHDVLVLTNIASTDVQLSRSGNDLLVLIKSTGEIITVVSHFSRSSQDEFAAGIGLESIRFADGEWGRAKIFEESWIRGTDGRDVLDNYSLLQGSDSFHGGKGNDIIQAGNGANTFVYASGDGNDVISDTSSNFYGPNSIDVLRLTNLNAADIELSRSGNDLMIKVLATGEVIAVLSQFNSLSAVPDAGLEKISFANGEEWERQQLLDKAWFRGTDGRDAISLDLRTNDIVDAGRGDDLISSGAGSDTFLYGRGDGNDVINAEASNVHGSTDVDVLKFEDIDSADVQLNRSGDELLIKILSTNEVITVSGQFNGAASENGQGLEYIEFANGDRWDRETIHSIAISSSPFIAGTRGDDTLLGSSVSQNIYGEAGNDYIDGLGGNDLLYGGQGDDTLSISVNAPGDFITADGSLGTDTLDLSGFGSAAWVDLVTSGAEVRTRDGSDLTTGTWRDVADVARVENVTGTAYADQISGDAGDNVLIGGGGADILDGRSGNDTMLGGAGDDGLTGGMGTDLLDGGEGADVLNGGLGTDTLIGGTGDDTLTGGTEADVFVFGLDSGSDMITDFAAGSGGDHDVIRFDRAIFADYASVLASASQVGTDVAISLGNNFNLKLSDVDIATLTESNFEFRRLDNHAPTAISVAGGSVAERAPAGTVVAILAAIDAGDGGTHTFSLVGNSDLFEIVGNEVRVKAGANVDFGAGAQQQISVQVTDDDGLSVTSVITIQVADQTDTLTGTAGNDVLTGDAGIDDLSGGAGNDSLAGAGGGDTYRYNAGDGSDRIVDGGGAPDTDRLVLGAGIDPASIVVGRSSLGNSDLVLRLANGETIVFQDQLAGQPGAGLEEIRFADSTVWSRSDILSHLDPHLLIGSTDNNVTLTGSEGAETFLAGTGNETLAGYGGSDVYRIGANTGNDTIVEGSVGGTDRIELVGLNRGDVQFLRSGADLLIKITATGNTVTVTGQFGLVSAGVEEIVFADATVWNKAQISANTGTPGTSGADTIVGTGGDDVFRPGAGDDLVKGGAGNDTLLYALGDGNDTFEDGIDAPPQVDVLRFVDLNASDVTLVRQGNDLLVNVLSSGESIRMKSQFTSATEYRGIEQIQFANGAVLDRAAIKDAALSLVAGTSGAETLNGTSDADLVDGLGGNDTLQGGNGGDTYLYRGGSGNDVISESAANTGVDTVKLVGLSAPDVEFMRWSNNLYITIIATGERIQVNDQFSGGAGIEQVAFADGSMIDRAQIAAAAWFRGSANGESITGSNGDDTLDGKGGNDELRGYVGSDTYIYGTGYGNDWIYEAGADAGTDVVKLVGLSASDVEFTRWDNNFNIRILATGETLTVSNQFSGGAGVEQVNFADGTIWDRAQIASASWYRGTASGEGITGSNGDDTFDGKGGNDELRGYVGNDTYIYGVGSGNDVVIETGVDAGTDNVKLVGLNASDVEFMRWGNNLYITINATGERIQVNDQFSGGAGIEQVTFADGSTMDRAQVASAAWLRGTSGNDTITGTSDNDTIFGGAGNDSMTGGAGSDTFVFRTNLGQDTVTDFTVGTDVIEFRDGLFSDAAAVLAAATTSGSDTLITIDAGNTVLLKNVAVANLHASDFHIV